MVEASGIAEPSAAAIAGLGGVALRASSNARALSSSGEAVEARVLATRKKPAKNLMYPADSSGGDGVEKAKSRLMRLRNCPR
jgi:hypothetical protein